MRRSTVRDLLLHEGRLVLAVADDCLGKPACACTLVEEPFTGLCVWKQLQ